MVKAIKKDHRFNFSIIVFILLVIQTSLAEAGAKYIFLLIGDGMGTNQRIAADYYYQNKQFEMGIPKEKIKKLHMNTLPATGITTTFSNTSLITDSGAAGTALATGCKTKNGVISMDQTCSRKLETVAEFAKKSGMKVGIVTNVFINHATPAVFYSHQPNRNNYYEIALELSKSNFDYFGGGCVHGVNPKSLNGRENPLEIAVNNGFTIADTAEKIYSLKPGCGKVLAFDQNQRVLDYEIDRVEGKIALEDFVSKGIELLDCPEGFFFMIESGKLDWVCHANDAATSIKEIIALDRCLEIILNFYEKHPQDTLVIVTADHDTGAMRVGPASFNNPEFAQIIDAQKGSEGKFEPIIEKCKELKLDFDDAVIEMKKFFRLENLTQDELNQIKSALIKGGTLHGDFTYGTNNAVTIAWTRILAKRAGITWSSLSHTSEPVMTTSIGEGSEMFGGAHDNTDIAKRIKQLIETHSQSAQRAK